MPTTDELRDRRDRQLELARIALREALVAGQLLTWGSWDRVVFSEATGALAALDMLDLRRPR